MKSKNNKVCIICGKSYAYCPGCGSDSNKPSWYNIFDGENCKDIYDICTSYRDGIYDKKVAYEKINKCDISGLESFAESTKKQIEEILSYKNISSPVAKADDKVVENKPDTKSVFKNKK